MPTYEYLCPKGHEFERFQKITGSSRVRCPECGRLASRQISGGAGLIFKGSGFYITDYGKDGKGPRKPESESKSAESGAESGTTAKSDTAAGSGKTAKSESKPHRKKAAS